MGRRLLCTARTLERANALSRSFLDALDKGMRVKVLEILRKIALLITRYDSTSGGALLETVQVLLRLLLLAVVHVVDAARIELRVRVALVVEVGAGLELLPRCVPCPRETLLNLTRVHLDLQALLALNRGFFVASSLELRFLGGTASALALSSASRGPLLLLPRLLWRLRAASRGGLLRPVLLEGHKPGVAPETAGWGPAIDARVRGLVALAQRSRDTYLCLVLRS